MHTIAIPDYILQRVLERRGKVRLFETIDPARTALIVVDLQNGFMAPGQPAEIPYAREIVPNVNRIGSALRAAPLMKLNALIPQKEAKGSPSF